MQNGKARGPHTSAPPGRQICQGKTGSITTVFFICSCSFHVDGKKNQLGLINMSRVYTVCIPRRTSTLILLGQVIRRFAWYACNKIHVSLKNAILAGLLHAIYFLEWMHTVSLLKILLS
jgi:hypothetical protein